ncbi:MAG TPA: SPOR domain-containing protein [Micavibrio sp.]
MRKKDDFDDEFAESNAWGAIMNAMDLRAKFEARKPAFATSIVVAMVAVLGGVIWYSYPRESAQREVMNTPIVRADAGDYRTTPAEPGGMAIPYRESTVFNALRADSQNADGSESARVENLLPQAEQPVSRQELFAGLKVDEAAGAATEAAPGVSMDQAAANVENAAPASASADTVDEMAEMAAVTKADTAKTDVAKPDIAKSEAAQLDVAKADVKAEVVKAEAVKAEEVKAKDAAQIEPAVGVAKETKDVKTTMVGGYYVQLGSVRARDGAAGEWAKLQKSFAALSPLSMRVQEADLGAKGKFYRIQGGPVTEAQAKKICDSVKAQKPGGCLVVKQ